MKSFAQFFNGLWISILFLVLFIKNINAEDIEYHLYITSDWTSGAAKGIIGIILFLGFLFGAANCLIGLGLFGDNNKDYNIEDVKDKSLLNVSPWLTIPKMICEMRPIKEIKILASVKKFYSSELSICIESALMDFNERLCYPKGFKKYVEKYISTFKIDELQHFKNGTTYKNFLKKPEQS